MEFFKSGFGIGFGISQSVICLVLSLLGIRWSSHKVLNSVLNTQQLITYRNYSSYEKILIGLMNSGIESVILFLSSCVILKILWSFIFTPLKIFPLLVICNLDVD